MHTWPPDYEPDLPLHPQPRFDDDRHRSALAEIVQFDVLDLAANREGRLTPLQAEQLWHAVRIQLWTLIGVLSGGAGLMGLLGVLFLPGSAVLFLPMLVLMGLALFGAWTLRTEREALPMTPVHTALLRHNRLSLALHRWNDARRQTLFRVEGDQVVTVDRALYRVLRPNQDYAAYYVRLRHFVPRCRLVSIEPISAPDNDSLPPRRRWRRGPKRKPRKAHHGPRQLCFRSLPGIMNWL
ncbi:MAG: hypothetical protein GYB65_16460 [Chloroflexi bacterium]|nr:hypothetical protein [Chloroflexota bacterium]